MTNHQYSVALTITYGQRDDSSLMRNEELKPQLLSPVYSHRIAFKFTLETIAAQFGPPCSRHCLGYRFDSTRCVFSTEFQCCV